MNVRIFSFAETESWLRRRNPAVKIGANLTLTLLLTLVFDPITPLVFIGVAFLAGRLLGGVPIRQLAVALTVFWVIGTSLVLSNALFASDPRSTTVIWAWGPFNATVEGAMIGLSLAERMAAIAAFSVLFTMSTDPTDLVRSLVQQLRMAPRFAYTILAAYRFLPGLGHEYETIRLAQRLRGRRRRRGPAGWLEERRRLLVPLFTGAVRRTDRVALAMDSRGFGSGRTRTHYRRLRVDRQDAALLVVAIGGGILILAVSAALGVLRLWTGVLGA